MSEAYERLQWARERAGFDTATEAARALGIAEPTYLGHENGSRGFRRVAERYARRFGVSLEWLITGRTPPQAAVSEQQRVVSLVGYVGAGAEAHFYGEAQGPLEEATAPEGATSSTVAVEIRGDSLGSFFDRWLVFYDDVKSPVTGDLIGRLCVCGLVDGRVLIKKIQRSKSRGLFHLLSQFDEPILDVAIDWAARVKAMVPR